MVERSCVHPFIRRTQQTFKQGGTLFDALGEIKRYQAHANELVTDVSPKAKIPHAIGMSALGLGSIVAWEYARAHGLTLPDSKELVALIPVVSITGDDLTSEEKEWARKLRDFREENPSYHDVGLNINEKQVQDSHRRGAFGAIDRLLENGNITPREAAKQKRDWDKRHGY